MPAAAVIPAPRAYINVAAVKKPVVGFEDIASGAVPRLVLGPRPHIGVLLHAGTAVCQNPLRGVEAPSECLRSKDTPAAVTVSKTECSRQQIAQLNVKAWNDKGSTTEASFVGF